MLIIETSINSFTLVFLHRWYHIKVMHVCRSDVLPVLSNHLAHRRWEWRDSNRCWYK